MTELRFSRQIALAQWGENGQRRVKDASVLIVGVGGLGNPAALYLARSGIGKLVLNDFDAVDETNLPRQTLFSKADVGHPKARVAADLLSGTNPDCTTEVIDQKLSPAELLEACSGADVVVDGCDNFATRFAVNRACVSTRTPLVSGAAIRYEAQLAVFRFDCKIQPCYRCLYDEQSETLGDCEGQGVLTPMVGMIGAAMALEALRIVVGFGQSPDGSLLIHDALEGNWRRLTLPADPNCPVCQPRAQ